MTQILFSTSQQNFKLKHAIRQTKASASTLVSSEILQVSSFYVNLEMILLVKINHNSLLYKTLKIIPQLQILYILVFFFPQRI